MVWVGITLIAVMMAVFVSAVEKVKYGEFKEASWWLVSFGIYQWGHAIVLAAFWLFYGIACVLWWSPNQAVRAYLLFHVVRAVVELLLIRDDTYHGLAHNFLPHSEKVSADDRLRLYGLTQGIIILSSVLLLQYVPLM